MTFWERVASFLTPSTVKDVVEVSFYLDNGWLMVIYKHSDGRMSCVSEEHLVKYGYVGFVPLYRRGK